MKEQNYSEMLSGLKLSEVAITSALRIVKLDKHEASIEMYEKILAEIRRIIANAEGES